MRRACIPALVAALVTAMPGAAMAESPAGRWSFETDTVTDNCKLKGEMQIWPEAAVDEYSCRFIANQICASTPPLDIKVEQSCVATMTGSQLNIESTVERTVSVSPEDQRPRVDALYAPDNFFVSINEAGDEMTGMFHSVSRAFVRFKRQLDLTS